MAPIKFEENIKDKLEKRTLSPASDSWSKLAERLDNDEKKSKKPLYWWLSIAAGLLLMLAVTVQFYNTNTSEELQPQIVEQEVIKEQINTETKQSNEKTSIELIVNQERRVEEKEKTSADKNPKIIHDKLKTTTNSEENIQLAEIDEVQHNDIPDGLNKKVTNDIQLEIDKSAIKNAVTEAMKTLKPENSTVTDQEIDSLLKIASKEIFQESIKKEASTMVDATQLLESVEDEMGQSFRTKVFEALKESYETVKTAVADRNN
ncbi:hypothetical protein [Winogradskyella bathintestinalis]|uniref:Anti-sigma factor n=1 Tax=Winogradskyella bathintestinalis TaxID=3035208 RepID=A0ABT7ZXY3_9FLAO|nr:hypothetical protein [Winogradskyella bathintestinalis]MDN3493857.1 hypothetical protein [Winogradskyella bathintestinalis]